MALRPGDQRAGLELQKQALALYCASQGRACNVIADMGSGMNYHKKGLRRLLDEVLHGTVGRLALTHKDWLYGSRSRKNQKLIDGVHAVVREEQC